MQTSGLPLHEWLALLETYSPEEINLGLDRVETLLRRMDLPQLDCVLHVAGTNGKGSSAAMLESLLRLTDKKVGCYTSPHMLRYNERIRIDGAEASDAQIVAAFESIDALRGDVALTYFEFGTLAALAVFAEASVEIAILEVGMGGRLDAVNAIDPSASLITNVSLDHCAWLGENVEMIAAEKAGVMRADRPVIFASPELPVAIVTGAESAGANLFAAKRDYDWLPDAGEWTWNGINQSIRNLQYPSLAGDIQLQNAAGVLTLLEVAGFEHLLDATTVNVALGELQLAGRMQAVGENGLFDVAHNPAAAEALAEALSDYKLSGSIVVILGMLDDKDVEGVVGALQKHVDGWIAVTADSPRAIPAAELARRVANATDKGCLIAESIDAAFARAKETTAPEDLILVTGSFYVVGSALGLYSPRQGK
jgi:dihydrofolate synthase/folylpolyglutamate synthase